MMTPLTYDEQGYGYHAPDEAVLRRFVELLLSELLRQQGAGGKGMFCCPGPAPAGGAMAVPVPVQGEGDDEDE